ncbi:MAG TPA: hypothetical protein VHM25_28330 [Polyangiaceae bacterium]|jgi:hypothetical protein|nr:hypothetical protein [Polyangiaceae bacterium]
MRKLGLVGLVLGLGLGCSSSSDKGSTAVDPAAEDFCLQWANEVCRLAYLCVDAGAQDAAFHARYGASKDDCWEGLEPRCKSNQSGSSAFGPSCGPGKKVNTDLASACTQSLELETCAVWMVAPAGACDLACATVGAGAGAGNAGGFGNVAGFASVAGFGNTGGAGNAPGAGGSGTSTGSLSTSREFCEVEQSALCDRVFECKPTEAAQLGTLADCKASAVQDCADYEFCPTGYDATKGPGCVTFTKTATCSELSSGMPEICKSACH